MKEIFKGGGVGQSKSASIERKVGRRAEKKVKAAPKLEY